MRMKKKKKKKETRQTRDNIARSLAVRRGGGGGCGVSLNVIAGFPGEGECRGEKTPHLPLLAADAGLELQRRQRACRE